MSLSTALSHRQLRSVALPSEHGSWGFLLEPLLLGLLVAGSASGVIFSAAMLCTFLIHQPLKLALKDHLKGRRTSRTIQAERFAVGYGVMALLFLGIVGFTSDLRFIVPLLLGLPFLLIQIWYDARNQSRALIPELCGVVALGSTASAVVILGGWMFWTALPLWVIVVSRSIPSIIYVRTRLKLEHGKPIHPYPSWGIHSFALLLVTLLAAARVVPITVVVALAVLLLRALIGLSAFRKPRPAKQIGMLEIAFGLIAVAAAVIGYTVSG